MNNILKMIVVLLLMANAGFTQQNKFGTKLLDKGTLQQSNNLAKATSVAVQSDSSTAKTFDVAEGKKGLNAVNVKQARPAGSINENGRNTKPNGQDDGNPFPPKSPNAKVTKPIGTNTSGVDSTTTNMQTKHAINTKGSGATRDK
jgi:hypothetical protein